MADFFNNNENRDASSSGCSKNSSLCISKRHASLFMAGFLALFFFTFITGYFWGKRTAVEQLTSKIEEELLADQIHSSFYNMQERTPAPRAIIDQPEEVPPVVSEPESEVEELGARIEVRQEPEAGIKQALGQNTNSDLYFAQLIGFGTQLAANGFVQRVSKDIPVEVKKRTSQTARGKTRTWYQVVTKPYSNKSELAALVKKVSNKERLNGVQIVTC